MIPCDLQRTLAVILAGRRMGLENVRAFQVHLVSQGISWPALNQTVRALRFFYGVTLDRGDIPKRNAYARTPRKLPVIPGADDPGLPRERCQGPDADAVATGSVNVADFHLVSLFPPNSTAIWIPTSSMARGPAAHSKRA